jgi:hypothetical protein
MLEPSSKDKMGSVEGSVGGVEQRNLFDDQMYRIWKVFGVKRDVDLAKAFGKGQSTVSQVRVRGHIPAKWLNELSAKYGISPTWVLSGTGPMKLGQVEESQAPMVTGPGGMPGSIPGIPPGIDLQGFKISEMIAMTARVLESGTTYAIALALNIQHFDRAIQAESRIHDLEKNVADLLRECETMKSRMADMERRLADAIATGGARSAARDRQVA